LVAQSSIRQGDIYWLNDCPPLHGDVAKRRPVVVVSPTPDATLSELILVVACTSTPLSSTTGLVELPSHEKTPQTRSGLHRRTWAVPQWWLPVERCRLMDRAGYITGSTLWRVVEAFVRASGRP